MKRTLKLIFTAIIAASLCVVFAACGNNASDVKNQKGLHYKLSDGKYIVTGYTLEDEFDGKLTIPATYNDKAVTKIKAGAFSENENIKELTVPSTIEEIGEGAFAKMTVLEKLSLPFVGEKVDAKNKNRTFAYLFGTESFAEGAEVSVCYSAAESATTYYVPGTISTVEINPSLDYAIPDYAFDGMKYLDEIKLGEKVTALGMRSFRNCALIKTLDIKNVTEIGNYAFDGCKNLEKLTLPTTLKTIGDYAFKGLKFTAISIPDSVTFVGEGAFSDMDKLSSVVFGAGYTEIRAYTFSGCKALTEVTSNAVLTVSGGAFKGCAEIASIKLPNAKLKAGSFPDVSKKSTFQYQSAEDNAFLIV